MPNFGAVLGNIAAPLAQTVASHNFAEIAERDKQRQLDLQNIALFRQAKQDALNQQIGQARIGNWQSMAADRTARDEADPVVQAIPVQDGTMVYRHKSGKSVRVDANGNPVNAPVGPAPTQSAPPSAPSQPSSPNFSVTPQGMTEGLREGMGLRPIGQQATPTPPQQGSAPTPQPKPPATPAPAFGKQEKPAADPLVKVVRGGKTVWVPRSQVQVGESAPTPPEPTPSNVFVTGTDSAGKPVIYSGKSKGDPNLTATGVGKPASAANNAQANREKDYVNLIGQSLPAMEQLIDKVNPDHIVAALKYPTMGNLALTQDEQTFLLNARNALAGVLHQESGARLSDTQLNFGLQRFLPNLNDSRQTKHEKLAALRQLYNDRAGTAGVGGGGRGGGNPNQAPPAAAGAPPSFEDWLAKKNKGGTE